MALANLRRPSAAKPPTSPTTPGSQRVPLVTRLFRHTLFPSSSSGASRRARASAGPPTDSVTSSSVSSSGRSNPLCNAHELGAAAPNSLLFERLQILADRQSQQLVLQDEHEQENENENEYEHEHEHEAFTQPAAARASSSSRRQSQQRRRHRRRLSLQVDEEEAQAQAQDQKTGEDAIRRTRSNYSTASSMVPNRRKSLSQKLRPRLAVANSRRELRMSLERARVENDDLRRRVAQLEMAAVEKKVLDTKVSELEWALDVVRDDAERVREEALRVLMVEHECLQGGECSRRAVGVGGDSDGDDGFLA